MSRDVRDEFEDAMGRLLASKSLGEAEGRASHMMRLARESDDPAGYGWRVGAAEAEVKARIIASENYRIAYPVLFSFEERHPGGQKCGRPDCRCAL